MLVGMIEDFLKVKDVVKNEEGRFTQYLFSKKRTKAYNVYELKGLTIVTHERTVRSTLMLLVITIRFGGKGTRW